MRTRLYRIGTGFFVLWGMLHVLGGASLLATLQSGGGAAILRVLGSAVPGSMPEAVPGIAGAVAAFHAWNMLWVGHSWPSLRCSSASGTSIRASGSVWCSPAAPTSA